MSSSGRADWVENTPPRRRLPALEIGEIWESRELAYFFFLRDLRARYKQTVLGVAWVLLGPLTGALSFTFVFNGLAGIETEGSYFALALSGFITWNFISSVMSGAATSLLEHQDLITHVAFPMIAAPASVALLALVDLAVGSMLAATWAVFTNEFPSLLGILVGIPGGLALMIVTALGPGLFFAPAVVKYRDSAVVLALLVQIMFFLGPVAYPPELVGDRFQNLLYVNPVTGCVALLRWGFTSAGPPELVQIAISVAVACTLALVGLLSFRRNEHHLVDVI